MTAHHNDFQFHCWQKYHKWLGAGSRDLSLANDLRVQRRAWIHMQVRKPQAEHVLHAWLSAHAHVTTLPSPRRSSFWRLSPHRIAFWVPLEEIIGIVHVHTDVGKPWHSASRLRAEGASCMMEYINWGCGSIPVGDMIFAVLNQNDDRRSAVGCRVFMQRYMKSIVLNDRCDGGVALQRFDVCRANLRRPLLAGQAGLDD